MQRILLFTLLVQTFSISAQRINNTGSHRTINSEEYFRIHYENDYFSERDVYYTQGINLEYIHPDIEKIFISKLLLRSSSKETKFGIALEHEGYTPTSISHSEILVDDRPFAACFFLKGFSIINDPTRKERISSSLSAGVIGPLAGGREIQDAIHRLINYTLPQGWQHQIQNDVILNYQIEYERAAFSIPDYLSLSAKVGVLAGTLNTKAYTGIIMMAGVFDDPFMNFSKQKRKNQVYVYAEPLLNFIGYDATLQGGLFNRSSPYTLPLSAINCLVFQGNVGIVFKIKSIQFEYFQSLLTKEFETGEAHAWGGIRVGWCHR
jgi:lipid A 3-O-deacylase